MLEEKVKATFFWLLLLADLKPGARTDKEKSDLCPLRPLIIQDRHSDRGGAKSLQ